MSARTAKSKDVEQRWAAFYAVTSLRARRGVLGIVPYLGLPSGQRPLMIGERVASARDLQRYKELLLEKQHELSSVQGDAAARVPAAGGLEGDLIDQANADAEAELQIRLHQTDARLLRAIEEALARIKQGTFGVCQVCKQPVSKGRLEAVPWTRLCRECKEREHSAA